ncbi:DUF4411 family protein [Rosettibacter primus]|uniref:DUF4411 family protein n=1 Tax=Rosettibacter primus TaxID=3111523 RepID=UPI00336BEAE7
MKNYCKLYKFVTNPLDVVVNFWQKVKRLSEEEKIISIYKVREEIFNNDDEMKPD